MTTNNNIPSRRRRLSVAAMLVAAGALGLLPSATLKPMAASGISRHMTTA
jgi:hypothetical protein